MPAMVMEPSLPTLPLTHNSEAPAVPAAGDSNKNAKPHGPGSSPVSSIKLLKPKAMAAKKPSEVLVPQKTTGPAAMTRSRIDPARKSASELPRKVAPEKPRMSLSERPRKSSVTERPRRSSSVDHKNQEKREMEALVKKLSATPPNGAIHHHHHPAPPSQKEEKKDVNEKITTSDSEPLPSPLQQQEQQQCDESKEGAGILLFDAEVAKPISPGVEALKPMSSPIASQSPVLESVPPARKSRNTTPVRRSTATNVSEGGSEDDAPSAPLTPAKIMPLMPLTAVDAILNDEAQGDNAHLGPYLIKLAKSYAMGDDQAKAIEYGTRAVRFYEKQAENGQPSLDFIVSLHILAALHGRLGHYDDAIPLLERSVLIPVTGESEEHALAKFAGHMQLGDTYNLLGKQGPALDSYHCALVVQKAMLGDLDPRVGETCHYIAEAHLQAMEFQEAQALCEHALAIHREHSEPGSLEEAADRRLLALVFSAKGDHERALENLVLASATLQANNLEIDVAAVNSSIGDELLAIGRDADAVMSYQKALLVFKALKGDNHTLVAACYVSLAELYLKTNKPREAKTFCENALRIYGKQGSGHNPEDVANGLTDVAAIYEQMNEKETALALLQRALTIQDSMPGQQAAVGGIEAQMGILYNMMDKFMPALEAFKSATNKLKDGGVQKSALLGMLLNQMGITCVELGDIEQASQLFQESRLILEETCGPHHLDTLDVCTNLAGSFDALGRLEEAIKLLEYVVQVKEDKLGTVHPDVHDDRERLQELLKDVGRTYTPKTRRLEELLITARKENRKSESSEENTSCEAKNSPAEMESESR